MTKYVFILFSFLPAFLSAQLVFDDFEGGGTIVTWAGDQCAIQTDRVNPFPEGINTSSTVLEYHDTGGQFANVRFVLPRNFDFKTASPSPKEREDFNCVLIQFNVTNNQIYDRLISKNEY